MKNKLLSWLLVIALVITMVPGVAFTAQGPAQNVGYIDSGGKSRQVLANVLEDGSLTQDELCQSHWFYAKPNSTINLANIGGTKATNIPTDVNLIVGDGAKVIFPKYFECGKLSIYSTNNNRTGMVVFNGIPDTADKRSADIGKLGIYGVKVKSDTPINAGFRLNNLDIVNGILEIANKKTVACQVTTSVNAKDGVISIRDCNQGIAGYNADGTANADYQLTNSDIDITYTNGAVGLSGKNVTITGGTVDINKTGSCADPNTEEDLLYAKDKLSINSAAVNCISKAENGKIMAVCTDNTGSIEVNSGTLNAETGSYAAIRTNNFTQRDSEVNIVAKLDGLATYGDINVWGGKLDAMSTTSEKYGIAALQNLSVADGGIVKVSNPKIENSDRTNWVGVVSEDYGATYKVYGNPTINKTLIIESGQELQVSEGQLLIVGEGGKLVNNGTIINGGTIDATNGVYEGKEPIGGTSTLEKVSLEKASVVVSKEYTYNGLAQEPAEKDVKVTLEDGQVVDSAKYDISYENNVNAGNATIKVTAKTGTEFTGFATGEFKIKPVTIDVSNWEWDYANSPLIFDGTEKSILLKNKYSNTNIDKVKLTYEGNIGTNVG